MKGYTSPRPHSELHRERTANTIQKMYQEMHGMGRHLRNPRPTEPPPPPPEPAHPQNEAAVAIRKTGAARGLGVFVTANFPKKHVVILETPVFSSKLYTIGRRHKVNNAAQDWLKLSRARKDELRNTFRKLATISVGVKLPPKDRKILEKFAAEYAFRDIKRSNTGYIYKLACHMNHACESCANCSYWVEGDTPNKIVVKLGKAVEKDQELFIHYGKRVSYKCAVCPYRSTRWGRLLSGIGRSLRRIFPKGPSKPASSDKPGASETAEPESSETLDPESSDTLADTPTLSGTRRTVERPPEQTTRWARRAK